MTRSRTLSRAWRFPDLRNGVKTLHHITDTHFGAYNEASWVLGWGDQVAADLEALSVYVNAGHVFTGDAIHMYDGAGQPLTTYNREVGWYKSFRDTVKSDGLPYAECPGNHDMIGYGPDGSRTPISGAKWASDYGWPSVNNVVDYGEFKVITIGPDSWADTTNYILPQSTLDFLDNALQAAGKPCWVATHVPFNEQLNTNSGGTTSLEPSNPTLLDIADSNPNWFGHLSGHRHANIKDEPLHATAFSVGSRSIFGINGPSCIGGRKGAEVAQADGQWQAWNHTIMLTILDDGADAAVDVRWRDHNSRTWTNPHMESHRLMTLNNPEPIPSGFGNGPFGNSPFGA